MRILIASNHDARLMLRQTPRGDGRWREAEFAVVPPGAAEASDGDWLVVLDEPPSGLATRLPVERRIHLVTEPPGVKIYHGAFLAQFGTVISPLPRPRSYRGHYFQQQAALPWFYGLALLPSGIEVRKGWDDLARGPATPKADRISIVCSNKRKLRLHRQRLVFIDELRGLVGDVVDVYGTGFQPIDDKADVIAPYKYHAVLENNAIDHFWTEKTADAVLGGAFMFFSGCRNISDYFPPRIFRPVDLSDPRAAARAVRDGMAQGLYEDARDALDEARQTLMERYNVMAVLAGVALGPVGTASRPGAPAPLLQTTAFPMHAGLANLHKRFRLVTSQW